MKERLDVSDLEELLEWVDKLDGGGISREEYLSDVPAVWLGRVIDVNEGTAMAVLEALQEGMQIEDILRIPMISMKLEERKHQRSLLSGIISERTHVVDRMAIARLDGLGMRSNGYHITAFAGDSCDACIVIHGDIGASFGEEEDILFQRLSTRTRSFTKKEGFRLNTACDLFRSRRRWACKCMWMQGSNH